MKASRLGLVYLYNFDYEAHFFGWIVEREAGEEVFKWNHTNMSTKFWEFSYYFWWNIV